MKEPAGLAIILTVFVVPSAHIFVDLVKYQLHFWGIAAAFTLVGDAVTTSQFRKYEGLEEQDRGLVRYFCGAEPSLRCVFATRIIVLIGAVGVYAALGVAVDQGVSFLRETYLLLPVVLASMSAMATILNGQAIVRSERSSPD